MINCISSEFCGRFTHVTLSLFRARLERQIGALRPGASSTLEQIEYSQTPDPIIWSRNSVGQSANGARRVRADFVLTLGRVAQNSLQIGWAKSENVSGSDGNHMRGEVWRELDDF